MTTASERDLGDTLEPVAEADRAPAEDTASMSVIDAVRPPRVSAWPMWVLGLVIMIDQADQNVVRGVATPIQHAFHLTDLEVGVLLSCFIVVNGLVTVPAGYVADRWQRTRTVGHTVVVWSAITALTAAAWSYPALIAVRSALGFGQAVTEPSIASLLADHYRAGERGRAFAVQQCLLFVGFGIGLGIGGVVGAALGWRAAFLVVGGPGVLIAIAVYRLKEPKRGHGDRLEVGLAGAGGEPEANGEPGGDATPGMFDDGLGTFLREMVRGLVADLGTIIRIPTMRYALVGVSALLFTVVAVAAALPQFYEHQLHVATGTAELYIGVMIVIGGIPGVLLGGRLADRFAPRIRGGRMAIPAMCLMVGEAIFVISYLRLPLAPTFALEVVGTFVLTLAVPSLRAGISDAVPANLRGAGYGAFNLVSVVGGQAAASVVVFAIAGAMGDNYRTALLLVSPALFAGALIFLRARDHFDRDAAKILEAVVKALQDQDRSR